MSQAKAPTETRPDFKRVVVVLGVIMWCFGVVLGLCWNGKDLPQAASNATAAVIGGLAGCAVYCQAAGRRDSVIPLTLVGLPLASQVDRSMPLLPAVATCVTAMAMTGLVAGFFTRAIKVGKKSTPSIGPPYDASLDRPAEPSEGRLTLRSVFRHPSRELPS